MNQIPFITAQEPKGGRAVRALDEPIFIEATGVKSFHRQVQDAVHCHFDESKASQKIILC